MMLRKLLRDQSGASAAEYALIVGIFGSAVGLASIAFGSSLRTPMIITAYGPDGTAYRCTANCQMDYKDYCAALTTIGEPATMNRPTFSPALPAGGKCNGETPVS